MVTAKFTPFKTMAKELLWFLTGSTNVKPLQEMGCKIWDEWADPETGDLGPVYGYQWRNWPTGKDCPECGGTGTLDDAELGDIGFNTWKCETCKGTGNEGIDQIANVIHKLKSKPDDRRIIVSAWNVADVESGDMALPPCHAWFQFNVRPADRDKRLNGIETGGMHDCRPFLDCQLYQRSCDTFLGVPFNIASYALLMHLIAQVTNMRVGDFVWTGGDVHLYNNHFDQVEELLNRPTHKLPELWVNPNVTDIDAFTMDDFEVRGYTSEPHIAAPVSV